MSGARTVRLAAVALMAASVVAAPMAPSHATADRAAKRTTKVTVTMVPYGLVGHRINMFGDVNPGRSSSANIKLQRKIGTGSWKTVKTFHVLGAIRGGSGYSIRSVKLKAGFQKFRICAPATATAARGCSKAHKVFGGHWHKLGALTPAAHSAGYSVGTLRIDGATAPGSVLFANTVTTAYATYALKGGCLLASGSFGIDDNALGVVTARFDLYRDGARLGSAAIHPGPRGDTPLVGLIGARSLKVASTITVFDPYDPVSGVRGFEYAEMFCAW